MYRMQEFRAARRRRRRRFPIDPRAARALPLVLLLAFASTLLLALPGRALPADAPRRTPDTVAVATAEPDPLPVWVAVRTAAPSPSPTPVDRTPKILIYHTHATEAYTQNPDDPYAESGQWRTEDPAYSVVAVGARLAELLETEYGIPVLHDTTNHEPPKLSTAYGRSETTMRRYRALYPELRLFIDVHRDAYGKSPSGAKDYVTLDGLETARLMFVVGTGEGASGEGFSEMPDYAENFALAAELTGALTAVDPKLAREVRIKTGRYNQHIGLSLLVEVGHNANTLEQAKNALPHLARAIAAQLENGAAAYAAPPDAGVWAPVE